MADWFICMLGWLYWMPWLQGICILIWDTPFQAKRLTFDLKMLFYAQAKFPCMQLGPLHICIAFMSKAQCHTVYPEIWG